MPDMNTAPGVSLRMKVDQPLRIALAGAGTMASQHIQAIQALEAMAQVVGVADPSEEARMGILKRAPDAVQASSLPELLERTTVDVVHVCTPMEFHAQVAMAALERGCHVYVEKPVTPGLAELEPLLTLATKESLKVCAGHQVLFERPYRRLLELLPAAGRVVHVESYFSFRPVRTTVGRGRPLTQAEQLVDVLPHPTYMLLDVLERVAPDAAPEPGTLQVTPGGTVHGSIRRGELTGTLMVSLEARPVEHWLRIVGTNGTVHADFVRGSVQELLGPGTSGIDKALNPFRLSSQLAFRTASALGRRVMRRGGSYPGLEEIFAAFYRTLRDDDPSPTSQDQIRGTVRVCHEVRQELERHDRQEESVPSADTPPSTVLVTGGTGLLGREVVKILQDTGIGVRVIARRRPPVRERVPGVEYVAGDLAGDLPQDLFSGIRRVVHCAAETSGSWDAHQRNSVDATERLFRAAAAADVACFVHVSSVAVLAARGRDAVRDDTPLHPEPRKLGPYVWGKLESERRVGELARELDLKLKIVRPVPLIDGENFSPPGRLGRRVGNLYVAVGSPRDPLVVADARSTGRATAAAAIMDTGLPDLMNLVPSDPPTRRELVQELRKTNPELSIVWLPRFALHPLSWVATALQKAVRPRQPAVRLAQAFRTVRYEAGPAREWMSEDTSLPRRRQEVSSAS
jgi:predicted dehydrogenase/nucleoside-diphosphate-sugar epimerase